MSNGGYIQYGAAYSGGKYKKADNKVPIIHRVGIVRAGSYGYVAVKYQ